MIGFVLKILLAHFLGDFVLQPSKWVEHKNTYKIKSKFLYIHIGIHFLLLLILLEFNSKYLVGIITITLTHYIIDLFKLYNNKKPQRAFIVDQIAHIFILGVVSYIYFPVEISLNSFLNNKTLLFIIALVSVTKVSSIIMKLIMSSWELNEDKSGDSLLNAGKYIGILERLFVFCFILLEQWQAIGFLIAAKSVFRFGDLSKAKDRKLTEYILIGTLLSFGLAILIGISYKSINSLL